MKIFKEKEKMIRVGIVGVTGYVGIELLRLLLSHPKVKITQFVTRQYVGEEIANVYPHLYKYVTQKATELDINLLIEDCDVIFTSLPHGKASNIVQVLNVAGKKVIDVGSDFRLKNPLDYVKWYKIPNAPIELINKAVYGMPEIVDRKSIAQAQLVANPGCNSTAIILATYPALKQNIVDTNELIYDVKISTSGGGRRSGLRNHHAELSENVIPYRLAGTHRHTPEVEQELSKIAQKPILVDIALHMMSLTRGHLVTAYFKLKEAMTAQEIHTIYSNIYAHEPFIRICPLDTVAKLKSVRGTNFCDISIHVDMRTNRLVVISAIDNLIKGSGGQAIQNMNLMFELPETMGLENIIPIYP